LVPLYPETYAMTFPREGIVRLRARALVPLYPETYAITFPRGGIVRFAHWHSPDPSLRGHLLLKKEGMAKGNMA